MSGEELSQVIRSGDLESYKSSIDQVDLNIVNAEGQSFLHEAVVHHRLEMGEDLISKGINLNVQDSNGQTVLHYAALHGELALASIIIKQGGDVNICDNYGNNALWTATFNARGNYEIVKLYKGSSGDAHNVNKSGRSSLDFATQIKDEELMNILK